MSKLTFKQFIQKNYPGAWAEWKKVMQERRRQYTREWMKDHYIPAKKKKNED